MGGGSKFKISILSGFFRKKKITWGIKKWRIFYFLFFIFFFGGGGCHLETVQICRTFLYILGLFFLEAKIQNGNIFWNR